ncbi:MAG: HAD family phosphatase [Eubacterium sp.]|nr:HAD family phosphatase [Eubacterium sp.]
MPDGRILFTDLDGTLLTDDRMVSEGNRRAIADALERGNYIAAATGRAVNSAKMIMEELGLTLPGCYMIAFNGSVLYDCYEKRILQQETIPVPDVCRLFEAAHHAGIYIQTYNRNEILTERKTKELDYYAEMSGLTYRLMPDLGHETLKEAYKVLLIYQNGREVLEAFQKENEHWAKERLNSFFSSSEFLEYTPAGVSKGSAVRNLCRYLGIPLEHAVAVGDEWNDISMIQAAGIGAAVKNAVDAVKEAADYVTQRDHNLDAVAEVIDRFLL